MLIARATFNSPPLLILDEPARAGLAGPGKLLEALQQLGRAPPTAMIYVTHRLRCRRYLTAQRKGRCILPAARRSCLARTTSDFLRFLLKSPAERAGLCTAKIN